MAITLNYIYPPAVNGLSTPPTKVQVAKLSQVIVDVAFSAAADTTTDVVHNFNLPVPNGSDGTPNIQSIQTAGVIGSSYGLILGFVDGNTISVSKDNAGSSTTGTTRIIITRPHTLTR